LICPTLPETEIQGERLMTMNVMAVLAKRPFGDIKDDDFDIIKAPLAPLKDGQIRVETAYISLDPAMRGWMNDVKSYVPPVGIGQTMRALAIGTVSESKNPAFAVGDEVSGIFGVQSHAVSDGQGVSKIDSRLAPMPTWTGGLGMPGLTAYFGLLEVGQPKHGETVLVSAASGAVGQVVGQIAKIKGCRAVGIAGGAEKCAFLTDELGFDAAVDYKGDNFYHNLRAACPDGIDVNFENVGGEIFDTILTRMNPFGRIALCGLISGYNATELPPGPKNFPLVLTKRLNIRGFIVFDYAKKYSAAVKELAGWYASGQLKFKEDIRQGGIAAFPQTLGELYTGGNFGKLILKV
jgi:NADPH-dependent curcumin reductase CurA